MEWYQWVMTVGGLLAVPIAIGGAWALVRGSYNKARVVELREDNDDLRKRNADGEAREATVLLQVEALKAQVSQAFAERDAVTALLTQKAEVGAVLDLLHRHHDEAEKHWTTMDQKVDTILERTEKSSGQ